MTVRHMWFGSMTDTDALKTELKKKAASTIKKMGTKYAAAKIYKVDMRPRIFVTFKTDAKLEQNVEQTFRDDDVEVVVVTGL